MGGLDVQAQPLAVPPLTGLPNLAELKLPELAKKKPRLDPPAGLVARGEQDLGQWRSNSWANEGRAFPLFVRIDHALLRGPVNGGRTLALSWAVTVAPGAEDTPTTGADAEVRHALEALGYVFDDASP